MVLTRRRSQQVASPASTTNNTTPDNASAVVSPMFSKDTTAQPETPPTSDVDGEDESPLMMSARATRSKFKKGLTRKRVVEKDLDSDAELEANVNGRAAKRRAITKSVYVEIPTANSASQGKAKSSVPSKPKRNKGKAPVRPKAVDDPLEYDENLTPDESSDSGSEFEMSDNSSLSALDEDESPSESDAKLRRSPKKQAEWQEDDLDEDDLMIDAAIQESLESSRADRIGGAGPSAAREVRNAVTEIAIRRAREIADEADEAFLLNFDSESVSSEEQPLSKGKGGRTRKRPTRTDDIPPKVMTYSEMRQLKKEQRRRLALERKSNKAEEMELRKKLGRKLTPAERTTIALYKHHPELKTVWGDIEDGIPVVVPEKAAQPANLKVTLLPFQLESLFWMRKQEQGPWRGGMLADEMGMGKTIQMISLFVSDGKKPNLVIAPTVAIMQWRNEIQTHADGLSVLVWHGQARESNIKELRKHDVVLTTYAIIESCFRKQQSGFKRKGEIVKEKSAMHQIKWNRIILDEAHNIKDRATNTAKAAFELQGEYRWCLSGTPLQNRVGELYSLIRFLGGDPFSYYFCKKCDCKSLHWKFSDKRSCDDCGHNPMQHTCFWNNEILTPIQKNGMRGPGKVAFKKLKILLDRMMLRRTKIQRADDLGLPPRTVIVRRDYFSPEEKELYLSLFSDAKRQFNTYLDAGTVLNNYSNIFSLLTRMRQMACHPDLVIRSKNNAGRFLVEETEEATVCRLCNEVAEDAIMSRCRHIFDRECMRQYLDTAVDANPDCPVCHLPLTIDLEAPALELDAEKQKSRQGILGRLDLDSWRSSSKIEALVEELTNLRKQDATTKSLVFSQFVSFLDLIAFRLQKAGFNICRLEGTMTPQARDATIQHFMTNVDVTVFLVSLKAGGVALNLTEASRVYLMDSWWNPAVEYQAMDRIHRLGQHRPVKAIKLVVEDSIESRIVQLQEKKSAMIDATLSPDDSAMGRLTPEDLGFLFRL